MPKLETGEPLLTDSQMASIAGRLVAEFPSASDADFVSWVQEPKVVVSESGHKTVLPQVAVLAVLSGDKLTKGAMRLSDFEQEQENTDAVMRLYRPIVREHLRILKNLEGLIEDK